VKRARVGLMLGCVQREFLSEINGASVRVLTAEGCEVVAPAEQGCCGALLMHAGKDKEALELTRRMIATFEAAGVDTILTNAGGCGSHVKQFSSQFKGKVQDIAEFLVELGPRAERQPLNLRVAYHDSCHLQHAQKVRTQPRRLLAGIPGLKLEEIPESTLCCGSAGIYNLVQPKTAAELGNRKADHIRAIAPDAVATGNVGCILQMRAALERGGPKPAVLHTIQILDLSIRG
jgi:glycolate oxidase iron-sulfur subunit